MFGSGDVSLPAQSAESLWGHLFIWSLWVTFLGFELGWRQGSHLVPKQLSLYRCQSDPIFGSGAKATQSDVPRIRTWVATRLLPLIVALLVPSRLVENFRTMNPCGSSFLMIRELKGVESMSSRRLLIEPGGAACEGSLPTRVASGRAACPCKVCELEGSECASSDMVV